MAATPPPTADPTGALPPFDFRPLTRVVFGPGTLARLGEVVRDLGGRRVLLVTDPGLWAAGHPQRARDSLAKAGCDVAVFDGVEENPTTKHVGLALDAAKHHAPDFLVAVGGGSAMDCAKGVNFLFTNGGEMSDYKGTGLAKKPMLPSVGVPTTAGTGSEAQSYALIADEKSHIKMACGDRKVAFRAAVLDPELTVSQPTMVSAVTGLDAITHAIESHVCSRRNLLSQTFSREAWRLLSSSFERVLDAPDDVAARGRMQMGANLAGMAIENAMLGAAHACANPLTAHYGITHGVAVGVLLPHVIRYNLAAAGPLYAELTPGGGEELARRVLGFLQAAGLPTRLSDCGVSPGIFDVLADEAGQQWTAKFNPRPVGDGDLLSLYRAAF